MPQASKYHCSTGQSATKIISIVTPEIQPGPNARVNCCLLNTLRCLSDHGHTALKCVCKCGNGTGSCSAFAFVLWHSRSRRRSQQIYVLGACSFPLSVRLSPIHTYRSDIQAQKKRSSTPHQQQRSSKMVLLCWRRGSAVCSTTPSTAAWTVQC